VVTRTQPIHLAPCVINAWPSHRWTSAQLDATNRTDLPRTKLSRHVYNIVF
jgi:hypothetical protein